MGWFIKMVKYKERVEKINSDIINDDIFVVKEETIDLFGKRPKVILDTSVVVKWFFKENEKNAKNADLILQKYFKNEIRIIAPELLLFELTNTINNKSSKNKDLQFKIIDKIFDMGIVFYINKEILKSALKIAFDTNESVYDCIFIATAEYFGGEFVTDDKKLYENYNKYSHKKIKIILLKEYSS